ncbi:MAG: type II toxin-antitoxin system RelE/ParE family toxin [Dysgonamonadaceae bacterium]|jgi:phage-related protein|nr:type II toxin-antitoxin system RelE/ParE family toxin [Dysgonamonadaceae bacterium]
MKFFETIFLTEADDFIFSMEVKTQKKILYNIRIAEQTNDPELFKKLDNEIWEFRISFNKMKIRILAFWDKTDKTNTLVLATSGFIKKTQKTPINEIAKAKQIRKDYFETKNKIQDGK